MEHRVQGGAVEEVLAPKERLDCPDECLGLRRRLRSNGGAERGMGKRGHGRGLSGVDRSIWRRENQREETSGGADENAAHDGVASRSPRRTCDGILRPHHTQEPAARFVGVTEDTAFVTTRPGKLTERILRGDP